MRRLPPLAALRAFEAAGRNENFTNAAAELGMTQAAVSYQVRVLEERLNAPLFVREKGRVRLSSLGARLLPALTNAFDTIETAFATHKQDDEGLLTVTTTYTFANTWLAWRLGAFQMEHPDLAVRMTTSNALVDLRSGEADVAVRAGPGAGRASTVTGCSTPCSRPSPVPNISARPSTGWGARSRRPTSRACS
jgi:LysR family transcriptional regulator, glycine cleavage system transcriptional activator